MLAKARPSGKSVCLRSYGLGFGFESGQTKDSLIGIHSFPALRSALKVHGKEQASKLTCCAVGKGTERDSPILE